MGRQFFCFAEAAAVDSGRSAGLAIAMWTCKLCTIIDVFFSGIVYMYSNSPDSLRRSGNTF